MNTKFFIFLCCALILICNTNIMPVDADRFQTLKIRHNESPDVCIFEADPSISADRVYDFDVLARVSVDVWVEALEKQYPKGDWEIKVHDVIPFADHENKHAYDYPECNIMITFDTIEDSQRLGYTTIHFNNSNHKYIVITVFTHQFDPNPMIMFTDNGVKIISIIPQSLATIQSVIQHELGHAFGLLHYNISTPLANGEKGNDRSMMYPSLDSRETGVIKIHPPEIYMLGQMYGEDGWGGYEYPVILKQCDFTSGFMYKCEW